MLPDETLQTAAGRSVTLVVLCQRRVGICQDPDREYHHTSHVWNLSRFDEVMKRCGILQMFCECDQPVCVSVSEWISSGAVVVVN